MALFVVDYESRNERGSMKRRQQDLVADLFHQEFFILINFLYQVSQLEMQQEISSLYNNHNEKSRMIEHFMGQVKTEDLLNIGFMRPIEVALRTHKHDKQVPADSLPKGLMIACKNSINDNKYSLSPIHPIGEEQRFLEDLRSKHMDNYISLLKKPDTQEENQPEHISYRESQMVPRNSRMESMAVEQPETKLPKHKGLEIGICVSMSGEDKKTLKNTLVGVANNIDELIRSGVSPDDIFVVVVIDGVRKVDKSLYEYFQQFQRQSQIFLEEDEKLTLRKKYQHQLYHSQVQKDEPLNYSKFLFKQEQFHERIESKFVNVRRRYDEILRIKGSIQNIKKENNKDNDNLKMIVNRLADKQKNILKRINSGKKDKSIVINEESIMKELASSEEECNQYINTRQDLAYVSVYRVPTTSLSEHCRIKYNELNQKEKEEEIQSQFDSERLMNDQTDRKSFRQSLKQKHQGGISKSLLYVNLFFCIKYKEAGKLNSHNWFFNGFCQEFNPKYAFLLDVGVRPYPEAIFKMYRHLKINPKTGGICGYLRPIQELLKDDEQIKEEQVDCLTYFMNNFFDIQRAQQIEYHYEHFLQKAFEANFKFIHVVPGSFSGYSMTALRPPGKKGDELLREYFRSVDEKITTNKIVPSEFTVSRILGRVLLPKTIWKRFMKIDPDSEQQLLYNQNTYQSENRILCLGIHKNKKDIAFIPNAYAQVEPIKKINDLMEQKKLEFNGGMFSFEKVQDEFETVTRKREKFLVRFQLLYISFLKFLSYFSPAILIFALQFATEIVQTQFLASLFSTESASGIGNVLYRTFANLIIFIYALCVFAIFFFSIHLKAKEQKYVYYAHLISTMLGVLTTVAALVFVVETIKSILRAGDSYLQQQYLIQLETFLSVDFSIFLTSLLRIMIFLSIVVSLLPAIFYSFAFGKFGVLWETVVGIPAYIFYFPTYTCILPIYAHCRLDDIYSGDTFKSSAAARNQRLRQTWKVVKMIDVAKYLFWNCVIGITLLLLQGILLLKFFMLLALLTSFTILSLIKEIPAMIYIIRYKCHKRDHPLQPTNEERQNNIAQMKLRIFDTIKRFQDDFTFNIKESFEEAAVLAEAKEVEKKNKEMEKEAKQKEGEAKNNLARAEPLAQRNGSIQFNNIVQMNGQTNLTNKLQTIRESSAANKNFYPFQFGQKEVKAPEGTGLPLEMILLKNKIGSQASQNSHMKEEQAKLKKYQNFRNTIRPIGV